MMAEPKPLENEPSHVYAEVHINGQRYAMGCRATRPFDVEGRDRNVKVIGIQVKNSVPWVKFDDGTIMMQCPSGAIACLVLKEDAR